MYLDILGRPGGVTSRLGLGWFIRAYSSQVRYSDLRQLFTSLVGSVVGPIKVMDRRYAFPSKANATIDFVALGGLLMSDESVDSGCYESAGNGRS